MNLQTVPTETKEQWLEARTKDITSTEVSALFGISPYITEFELWHRKKDQTVVEIEENERMKWGTRLQDSIAAGIAEDNKWTVRRMDEYMRIPELRIGSSFDFSIEPNGLLEIKNVDGLIFKQQWLEDEEGNLEAPLHIEIQVQHQLAVCGRDFAYIGALVGGNNVVLLKREKNQKIIDGIFKKVAEFWKSVEADNPPPPNFETDASFICDLYANAEPGKVVDVRDDAALHGLAAKHKEIADNVKMLSKEKEAIKAQILSMIGDSEKAIGNGFSITAGMVGECPIQYVRKAYRNFRVNWKKGK